MINILFFSCLDYNLPNMDFLIDLTEECPEPTSIVSPLIPIAAGTPQPSHFLENVIVEDHNNPFDQALQQAADFGDPFECVLSMALKHPTGPSPSSAGETATGNLIQIDSPLSASMSDEQKMLNAIKFKKESKALNAGKESRLHSDSDISSLLKSIKNNSPVNRKPRSNSLDQLVRRNQLLKHNSLANSSPHAQSSPFGTPDRSRVGSRDVSLENLLDTSPRWVDSETDESELESMCIPFLKQCTPSDNKQLTQQQSNARKSLAMDSLAEHIERHKSTQPIMPVVVEESPDELQTPAIQVDPPVQQNLSKINSSLLLETLKAAIDKCDNLADAKAILANLNKESGQEQHLNENKDTLNVPTTTPTIVRQGTFNMEEHLRQNGSPDGNSLSTSGASGGSEDVMSASGEISPRTHMENVCKQLGLMNVNVDHWVVPNGELYLS